MWNFNIGVLGHVDSGKTSLVKALSTTASTAAFDKNPQSKERGITLDLGFSSFLLPSPPQLKSVDGSSSADQIQITLVDCPGHASLIRTIIGGSQIIELMLLVVDAQKGVQTQTAECLIIGEILCDKMIVALNKVDLLPESSREAAVDKMSKKLSKTLQKTKFAGCKIIPVAANPGACEQLDVSRSVGLNDLIGEIRSQVYAPVSELDKPSIFSVDHCFSIRGQGTVLTGTLLQGKISINDTIEIPELNVSKKVKSMQMFKKPVSSASQGDRVGVCVTQFDPASFERGYICTPGTLSRIHAAVVTLNRIPYYKLPVTSKSKFHITIGHDTAMASLQLFSTISDGDEEFGFDNEYQYQDELTAGEPGDRGTMFGLLQFDRPVICSRDAIFIASKLDLDVNTSSCRIAFHGRMIHSITDENYSKTVLPKLQIYKKKERHGTVERTVDDYTLIGKNLFKKETNIQSFVGLTVVLSTGETGVIEGSFGQSGKFKIRLQEALKDQTKSRLQSQSGKKSKGADVTPPSSSEPITITMNFKRFIYDPDKKMKQT